MRLCSLVLGALLGCGAAPDPSASPGDPASTAPARPEAVDAPGLKAALASGEAVLVDVRTPAEYQSGHVPGAISLPLDQLPARLDALSAHQGSPVYLICASGGRSARAQTLLSEAGFARPINVEGGTRAWIAAGLPVE